MQTERRVAANPQSKPTDLGCEPDDNWKLSVTSTIAIYYYYSAGELINQSINLFCHTQTQLAVISIANTFRLCVTGSTQGAYAPHKRATHVQ